MDQKQCQIRLIRICFYFIFIEVPIKKIRFIKHFFFKLLLIIFYSCMMEH